MTARRRQEPSVDCVDLVELVTDYLEDALPADVRALVDAHLAECPGCLTYVDQMRSTVDRLGGLPPTPVTLESWAALLSAFRRRHPVARPDDGPTRGTGGST